MRAFEQLLVGSVILLCSLRLFSPFLLEEPPVVAVERLHTVPGWEGHEVQAPEFYEKYNRYPVPHERPHQERGRI